MPEALYFSRTICIFSCPLELAHETLLARPGLLPPVGDAEQLCRVLGMSTLPVAWTNHQHLAPTEDVASWTLVDVARLTDSLFAIALLTIAHCGSLTRRPAAPIFQP